ncbi:CDP-glycerol glycerophosphotransferase family protein [Mesobacillus subterraneus]|uniref:CDP-ribitol ribitolphosphotransferase n=1 Tax=Mesobacillus subterraneus TaxID=285983 RepID=A0A3R9EZY2_9BACI|nr:CDP-glycerol glycerophosphotransferase family protein [Mesobacillus subterraneus]RSD26974.1 hypothetical protein EJA10_10510 [Mesobacillus subterraneus]
MGSLKYASTIITKKVLQVVHFSSCLLFKVNKNKITFASYRSDELSGNLLYLSEALKRKYPDKQYVTLMKRFDSSVTGKVKYFVHLIKATYSLATSAYFIIDDFYIPVYFVRPRENTEVIQLWHAAGIFKKFGLSTVGKPFGPRPDYLKHVKIHSNYSRLYVSSADVVPYYAEAFGMDEDRIYPLGLPRTDYFFSNSNTALKERFFNEYPNLRGKKLLLYAPTYRGKSHYQDDFQSPIDFQILEEKLGGEYRILIHLHPYMRVTDISDQKFVYHIQKEYSILELMSLADILITDYSSVIFDYSLLGKPMVFFAHDLEDYKRERDFYLDYKEMVPGPVFAQTEALADWIKNEDFNLEAVKNFKKRFFDFHDGKASERIAMHIMEDKTGG